MGRERLAKEAAIKIETIITCSGFSDLLAHTLPENMEQLDRVVVVTHHDDKDTIGLCNKMGIDVVRTDAMHEHGAKFNKGRLINLGLGHLQGLDWILHIDADILLPHRFRDLLHRTQLKEYNIYGADRLNVYGYDHWAEHKHKVVPHFSDGYFVQPVKEFPVGARIVHYEHGYTPIGYFQLWHKSQHRRYPIHQGNAEHTDVLFSIQWPRNNRILLPEVLVYHLDSEKGPKPMGQNWNGRKSPRFGPPCGHPHHHPRHCPRCHHHHGYRPHCDDGGGKHHHAHGSHHHGHQDNGKKHEGWEMNEMKDFRNSERKK